MLRHYEHKQEDISVHLSATLWSYRRYRSLICKPTELTQLGIKIGDAN